MICAALRFTVAARQCRYERVKKTERDIESDKRKNVKGREEQRRNACQQGDK